MENICEKLDELTEILSCSSNFEKDDISLDLELVHDLNINGDEASEVLEDISRICGVNFENLKFSDYFAGECTPDMIMMGFRSKKHLFIKIMEFPFFLFWSIFGSRKKYKVLTVNDLYKAVKRGYW